MLEVIFANLENSLRAEMLTEEKFTKRAMVLIKTHGNESQGQGGST